MKQLFSLLVLLTFLFGNLNFALACTIFNVRSGDKVLVGNNEDFWYEVEPEMWFVPASKTSHGRVLFGWNKFAQGGMNDQGLFFDAAATPKTKMPSFPNKPKFKGNIGEEVLEKCATVAEAVALIEKYNFPFEINGHLMFVDKSGDSAVVEWVAGELKIIKKEGSFQTITNFFLSKPELGGMPCARFSKVQELLQQKSTFTGSDAVSILSQVTQYGVQDKREGGTLYSNVYDLTKGEAIIFYKRNFNNPVKINLSEELKKGKYSVKLESLFKS